MLTFSKSMRTAAAALLVGTATFATAEAADLRVALKTEPSSMDPHFHVFSPNIMIGMYTFDKLVNFDEKMNLVPGLATSWIAIDDRTWEIKLRPGVKFHDGTPLSGEDVKFTIARAVSIPNSPSSYERFLKPITEVEVVDPTTVRLKTAAPFPLIPRYLATFAIVSKKHAENLQTADYNTGKAMMGTGPFKFVEWVKGDRIVFTRNDAYWGAKAPWDKVTLRPMGSDAVRVAALLAGDVDVVEQVPTTDIANLKSNAKVSLVQGPSSMMIYLAMDSNRDASPFVTDKQGRPLDKNPLKDARVRRAISKAINREVIVDRVMEKNGFPAGQIQLDGTFAASPKLKPEAFDPDGARKLLAEAGWGDGFGLTLHASKNHYVNDDKVAETIAQMLVRVGIATKVETMPSASLFSRGTKLEFSFLMAGWGSNTGEPSEVLAGLLHTNDPDKGLGGANRGRFSNKELDTALQQALVTVDKTRHEQLLMRATEVARENDGVIFVHFQTNTWGLRKGLTLTPRVDSYTLANVVSEAK